MKPKLKTIDKLLILYLLIIALLCLTSCKTKKVNEQRVDSLVKETLTIRDSIRTRTILEYETIYDTIRQQYITHIKKVSIDESQNKALQSTSDTKVSSSTKEKLSEPREPNMWLKSVLFLVVIIVVFFVGFFLRK